MENSIRTTVIYCANKYEYCSSHLIHIFDMFSLQSNMWWTWDMWSQPAFDNSFCQWFLWLHGYLSVLWWMQLWIFLSRQLLSSMFIVPNIYSLKMFIVGNRFIRLVIIFLLIIWYLIRRKIGLCLRICASSYIKS